MKKNLFMIILLSLLLLIFSLFQIIKTTNKKFEDNIRFQIERKNFILNKYLNSSETLLYTLKDSFIENLNIVEEKKYIHPSLKHLSLKNNNTTHYTKVLLDKDKKIYASINGLNSSLNKNTINEIVSLLYLNPIFKNSIKFVDNLLWVYYTSSNNFVYLAPTDMQRDENFIKELYTKDFWTDVILANNPTKDLIITNIYIDSAYKGPMTSLSLPVYVKNSFKGVFSIDIGLDTIKNIINNDIKLGKLYLLKEDNTILNLNDTSNLGETLYYKNLQNISFVEKSTFHNKLKLVYIINKEKKKLIILKNSLPLILISLFVFSIIIISFYLLFLTKKIKQLSNIDPLTSLLNRRAMESKITTLLEISERYEQDLSFLMLDLDDFKKVNDKYGHLVGDTTLVKVSKVLEKNSRKADLVSRYGGEEFLICLANTELHSAYKLAERIRRDVSDIKIKGVNKPITVSIGCTQYINGENIEKSIDRADKLLYKAKANGKNQTITGVRF